MKKQYSEPELKEVKLEAGESLCQAFIGSVDPGQDPWQFGK